MKTLFIVGGLILARVALAADAISFEDPRVAAEGLFAVLDERLSLMEPVAAWKWQRHQPVTDAAREVKVLDATAERARRLGVDPGAARHLLELQIGWARLVEERAVGRWDAQGFDKGFQVRDLDRDLRPALDHIGERLLLDVYLGLPVFQAEDFAERHRAQATALVSRYQLPAGAADELLTAMGALRPAQQKTLERVAASRVLRVAVTGDYAPFSLDDSHELRGADVELASELAQMFDSRAVFVKTTWPTLLSDYEAGHFDIAMGGISVNPERASRVAFSVPYRQGGKTSIARCSQRKKFTTLSDIDRPGVRVAVNPGGTNERFVRQHVQRAQIVIFEDNRTIFQQLVAKQADVMITDDAEVELQTKLHPELCRANPKTFDHSDKAWMMARGDDDFVARVNAWLLQAIADGRVSKAFDNEIARLARTQRDR